MFCFCPRYAVVFITVQTSIRIGVEDHTTLISLASGKSFGFFHLAAKRQALWRNLRQCHKCLLLEHSGWFSSTIGHFFEKSPSDECICNTLRAFDCHWKGACQKVIGRLKRKNRTLPERSQSSYLIAEMLSWVKIVHLHFLAIKVNKIFVLKLILCTRENLPWQACRKFSLKLQEVFLPKSKKL